MSVAPNFEISADENEIPYRTPICFNACSRRLVSGSSNITFPCAISIVATTPSKSVVRFEDAKGGLTYIGNCLRGLPPITNINNINKTLTVGSRSTGDISRDNLDLYMAQVDLGYYN